eukprot:Skav229220  [mRNA]  locus=scaffold2439:167262:171967:+ [translate_table: standard]
MVAGKVSHALAAGSIVSAGELLAKLELKDPSKVKKISPFEGQFTLGATEEEPVEPMQDLLALLDGFCIESKGPEVVQPPGCGKMFEGFANHQAAAETVRGVLEKYLSNERPFATSIDKKYVPDMREEEMDGGVHQKVLQISQLPSTAADIFAKKAELLKAAGVGEICLVLPQPPRHPRFAKFVLDEQEDAADIGEMG